MNNNNRNFIKVVKVNFLNSNEYRPTVDEMRSRYNNTDKVKIYVHGIIFDKIVFDDEALYVEFFLKHSDIIISSITQNE